MDPGEFRQSNSSSSRVGGEGRDGVKAPVLVIEGVQTGGGSLDEWMNKVDSLGPLSGVLYLAGRMTLMMGISELGLELETIKELGSIPKQTSSPSA